MIGFLSLFWQHLIKRLTKTICFRLRPIAPHTRHLRQNRGKIIKWSGVHVFFKSTHSDTFGDIIKGINSVIRSWKTQPYPCWGEIQHNSPFNIQLIWTRKTKVCGISNVSDYALANPHRLRQNDRHFANAISIFISFNENLGLRIRYPLVCCDYLSMLRLKVIHVIKRSSLDCRQYKYCILYNTGIKCVT